MPQPPPDETKGGQQRHNTQQGADPGTINHNPPQNGVPQGDPAAHSSQPAAQNQPHGSVATPATNHQRSASDDKHQATERLYWGVTGAASVIAAVFAGIAAWYASGAYEAAIRSVSEAQRQVKAANEANQISARTLAASVGASVHVGHTEFRMLTEAHNTNKITVQADIGNDGGTTTRGLSYVFTCTDSAVAPPDPFNYARLSLARTYKLTLAPKEQVKPILCSFSLEDWARITVQHGSIYVFGHASYRDTVSPTEFHHLEFCTRLYDLSFSASAFNPGPYAHGEECERHNCADDECEAQR